jgi:hypothetical protein
MWLEIVGWDARIVLQRPTADVAQKPLEVAALSIAPIGPHSFSIAGPDSSEFSIESSSCSDSTAYPATCSIAITRSRIDPETRAYLAKKRAEGKGHREAMRCLKRHLARRFYRLLLDPSPS